MKTFIFTVNMLLISCAVSAQDQSEAQHKKFNHCIAVGAVYSMSSEYKRLNVAPQNAVNVLAPKLNGTMTRKQLVKIVNQVYFDLRFEQAGGDALRDQMTNLCFYGPKVYATAK